MRYNPDMNVVPLGDVLRPAIGRPPHTFCAVLARRCTLSGTINHRRLAIVLRESGLYRWEFVRGVQRLEHAGSRVNGNDKSVASLRRA